MATTRRRASTTTSTTGTAKPAKKAAKKAASAKAGMSTTTGPTDRPAATGSAVKEATRSSGASGASGARDAFAAGAARASGERARRRGTPLVAVPDLVSPPVVSTVSTSSATERRTPTEPTQRSQPTQTTEPTEPSEPVELSPRTTAKHRPQPVPRRTKPSARVQAREGGRQPRPESSRPARPPRASSRRAAERALHPVPDPAGPMGAGGAVSPGSPAGPTDPLLGPVPVRAGESRRTVVPGVEDLVQAGVAALRAVAMASGVAPDEVEHQVAATLAFLRRRLVGDFSVDDFGFDEDFTVNAFLPLVRPLYKTWFRVEVRGIENIPTHGGGLVVSNHSGTLAFDSLMTQVAVYDETETHRHLRMLGADFVFQTPVVSQMARKSGSTLAANVDAERLLSQGELVGVWPEGFKGIGKPFSERYKLQRFGRGGFVSSAIRAGAPIIPCSIVGAEEIYPMIGNLKTFARLVGAPYAPVTPTWPLLGPLGLIPLPSKWIIEFGVPVDTADLGPGAADDPMLIFDLTDRVRETIQQTLYSLLMQRRSVFF